MFPGPNAEVYRNDEGEPIGWSDTTYDNEPDLGDPYDDFDLDLEDDDDLDDDDEMYDERGNWQGPMRGESYEASLRRVVAQLRTADFTHYDVMTKKVQDELLKKMRDSKTTGEDVYNDIVRRFGKDRAYGIWNELTKLYDEATNKPRKSSSRTAAEVGGGPGYYILSQGSPISGPYGELSLAHADLPRVRGDAVQFLSSPERARGSYDGAFPMPSGYGPEHPLGAFPGSTGLPQPGAPVAFRGDKDRLSKLNEITRGIMATNPGMDRREARRIARRTIEQFPVVARRSRIEPY